MSIFRSDDPGRDFDRWDDWKESFRKELPRCDKCHREIEDERYVEFDGFKVCGECLEKHYTRDNEAYCEGE